MYQISTAFLRLCRFINASSQQYIIGGVYLIGGDGCGLTSSAALDGATATTGAAGSGRGFATTRRGGFAATSTGLATTGGGLFRHYIY
jgi:hypothetical protein